MEYIRQLLDTCLKKKKKEISPTNIYHCFICEQNFDCVYEHHRSKKHLNGSFNILGIEKIKDCKKKEILFGKTRDVICVTKK